MLSTLLTSIQTALSPVRGFLIVAFVPMLFFVAANVALLRQLGVVTDAQLAPYVSVTDGFELAFAIIAISMAALLLTFLQPWLLAVLEGKHLPGVVRAALQRRQTHVLDALKERAEWHFKEKGQLKANAAAWRAGIDTLLPTGAPVPDAKATVIAELADKRRRGAVITCGEIAGLYAITSNAGTPSALPVEHARKELTRVIRYAEDRSRHQFFEVQNRMQFTYPGDVYDPDPSSDNVVAPTAFGNIGRTMRSYALRRYGLDLDIFWTRFQKVMADDSTGKLFDTLQTQKTLVDTAVTLFWLTILFGVIWIPLLTAWRQDGTMFRVVALGVPLAAWALYQLALQAYLVFADHVRTSVDYYRFKVLGEFHVTLPPGTTEERAIWQRLGGFVAYANEKDTFIYAREQQR
jgi:hypothetical protein